MAKSQYEHRDKKSMIKEESCASLVSMTSSRSISSIDIAFETIRIIRLNIDRNQSTAFSLSLHQRNKLRVKIKRETSEEKYLSNWYNKICYILISQDLQENLVIISPSPFLQELRFIIQVKWICTIKFNNFCYSCRIIKNCTLFCYLLPAINWLGWKYRVILMLIIVTRRYIEPLRFAVYEYSYTANVYFVFRFHYNNENFHPLRFRYNQL